MFFYVLSQYASISRNPYQFGSLSSRATSSQNTSRPDSRHQSNAGNFKPVLAVDTTQPMTPEKSAFVYFPLFCRVLNVDCQVEQN
jgi:hypothetical protein